MWKPILAGTAALAIAGSSLVYAQQRFERGPDRGQPERGQSWQPSPEDRAAFLEARIAALRAGLQLTPEQEKNWPAFETAIRDLVKNRRERMEAWRDRQPASDPTERLKRRADALSSAGAALAKVAEAQGPLYASLDEGQKRRFAMLSRRLSGGPGMMGHHRHHHMGRDGMGREGMGRDGMGREGMGSHGMMGRHGMRDDRGEGFRRDHHGWRGERWSDADRFRERRDGRDGRMDGRGEPDRRDERGRDLPGRGMGPMGGEERL